MAASALTMGTGFAGFSATSRAARKSGPVVQNSGSRITDNPPTYTFGPRGFRGDFDAPVADSEWLRSHGTSFKGGISSAPAPYFPGAEPTSGRSTGIPVEPPILRNPRVPTATGTMPVDWNGVDQALNPRPSGVKPLPANDAPLTEWTTSPGDRRFLPSPTSETVASSGGRSPSIVSDPNLDWTGTDEQAIASSGGRSPSIVSDPNADWIGTDETPTVASGGGRSPAFTSDPNDDWTGATPSPSNQIAGNDIRSFGGNMTLGQFLSTPLALFRLNSGQTSTPPTNQGSVLTGAAAGGTYNSSLGTYDSFDAGGNLIRIPGDPPPGWTGPVPDGSEVEQTASVEPNVQWTPSNDGDVVNGRAVSPESRAGLPLNATVFGYNPSSGGGGGTSRYDYGTGRTSPTPSQNPLYSSSGGPFQSVAGAPVDVRWRENSGTGNFQASRTTRDFLAGGGYSGNPNNMASAAIEGRFLTDEEGTPRMQGRMYGQPSGRKPFLMSQKSGAPPSYANKASQAAYNDWLMKQPEYKAWLATKGG